MTRLANEDIQSETDKSPRRLLGIRSRRVVLCLWAISAIIAVNFCIGTGLINGWGTWYSSSMQYRRQTEALLKGRIALSTSPSDLDRDMVWFGGRVQQVWGLGVPCWRLLFEAPARWLGEPAFPDRVAFAIALCLLTYAVLRRSVFANDHLMDWRQEPHLWLAIFFTVLFPPFFALCKAQLNVYEEAVAYGYICAVGMFVGTLTFVRRPRFRLYLILCFCGGFLPFIRPTVGVYGFATVVIAWFVSRRAGWALWKSFAGPATFGVGILLLLWSNQQRFGSFLEFGHKLNLSATNCEFLSQFYNPYGKEPLWSAARELVGSLFFTQKLSGPFQANVVRWQSPTIRYRLIYHTTFDWTFLVGILMCWALVLRQALLWRRTRTLRPEDVTAMTAGVWSLLAFLPLFAFYLHFAFTFSRYLFDFAPAFGVAMFGTLSALWTILKESGGVRLRQTLALAVLSYGIVWWGFETASIRASGSGKTLSQETVVHNLQRNQASGSPMPTNYVAGQNLPKLYGIPFNGEGWSRNGKVGWVVTLFVHDLNRLSLELGPISSNAVSGGDCASIHARIGEEFLQIESIQTTDRGKRVTFAPPASGNYRQGIQDVFVAFATPTTYRREDFPLRLLEVNWTQSGSE